MGKLVAKNALGTLPLLLSLLACLVWGGRHIDAHQIDLHEGECLTAWCVNRPAFEASEIQQIVNDQLAARPDCTSTPHPSKTALVTKAHGRIGDGLAMVYEMPFDQAYKEAKAGRVWVQRFCG